MYATKAKELISAAKHPKRMPASTDEPEARDQAA
jgi:hypothetical protein